MERKINDVNKFDLHVLRNNHKVWWCLFVFKLKTYNSWVLTNIHGKCHGSAIEKSSKGEQWVGNKMYFFFMLNLQMHKMGTSRNRIKFCMIYSPANTKN